MIRRKRRDSPAAYALRKNSRHINSLEVPRERLEKVVFVRGKVTVVVVVVLAQDP